jgi:hypothetical protein
MKKILLFVSAWAFNALTIHAQTVVTDSSGSTLKPHAGNVATELNLNPFNGSLSLNNSLNQIKFRYFTSPALALRLGITGNKVSSVSENNQPYGNNPYQFKDERSSTTLGLNLGIEKHFAGTKRLSPYLGADLALASKSTEQEITEGQTVTTITGAWREYVQNPNNPYPSPQYSTERGYLRYGMNVFTGFDFYMARHFFFGYEVNFGINKSIFDDVEITQTYSAGNPPANNNEVKNNSFTFGPSLMNGVRIGYIF